MLAFPGPRSKDRPLKEALREALKNTPLSSIPSYIENGLSVLAADAEEYRLELQPTILTEDPQPKKDAV